MDTGQSDLDQKLHAIADALNLLRSWHTAHLETDHVDIERQLLALNRRLTRLETAIGIEDHRLAGRIDAGLPDTPRPKRKRGRPRKDTGEAPQTAQIRP